MIRINENTLLRLVELCQQAIDLDRADQTQITHLQQQLQAFQQDTDLSANADLNNKITTLINTAIQVTPVPPDGGAQTTIGGEAPADGVIPSPVQPTPTPAVTDPTQASVEGSVSVTPVASPGDSGTATPATAPSTDATGGVSPLRQAPSGQVSNP